MIGIGLARRAASILLALAVALTMAVLVAPEASAASGCQYISMSNGAYNSTSYEYANTWSITPSHSGPYEWYLRRLSDDSIVHSGSATGYFQSRFGATTYRMQIHNVSGSSNTYLVCYWVT